MKILSVEYEESKNRAPEDETVSPSSTSPSSTPSSSSSTTPSTPSASSSTTPSTPSALGDTLLPRHGADFEKERKKLWREIKKIVLFMSLSMLTLQADRLHLSYSSTVYCAYAEKDSGFFGCHITG